MTPNPVSATEPDWERERVRRFYDPSRQLLRHVRSYQKRVERRGPLQAILRIRDIFWHRIWSIVTGADIPLNVRISGGLLLPHPNGVVIHPDVEIGPNCLIFQQATIGHGGSIEGFPRIGGHVDIGAGAKILGGIVVGDHAKIGANAVVLCDVPAGATAVGIPARIIPKGSTAEPVHLSEPA